MATNYSLEEAVIALAGRTDELKGSIENDSPDLSSTAAELSYISQRAHILSEAALGIDKIVSEL